MKSPVWCFENILPASSILQLSSKVSLSTWLCLSSKRTMMLSVPWPFLTFLMYALFDKEPLKRTSDNSTESLGIKYEAVEKGPADSSNAETFWFAWLCPFAIRRQCLACLQLSSTHFVTFQVANGRFTEEEKWLTVVDFTSEHVCKGWDSETQQ